MVEVGRVIDARDPAGRGSAARISSAASRPGRGRGRRADSHGRRETLHVAARAAARNARPAHEAPRELQHRHGSSQLPPSRGIAPRRVHSPMASLVLDRPLTLAARRPSRRCRRPASSRKATDGTPDGRAAARRVRTAPGRRRTRSAARRDRRTGGRWRRAPRAGRTSSSASTPAVAYRASNRLSIRANSSTPASKRYAVRRLTTP